MASTLQIEANRENSKLSTGPRTEQGKAHSSANSLKHGFCAADPVLPTEDRAQFDDLCDKFRAEQLPETEHQKFLVELMVAARWKLNRLEQIEEQMLSKLESPELAFTDKETAAGFVRLQRYRVQLERSFHRAARELKTTRKEQIEAKSNQIAEKKYGKLVERSLRKQIHDFQNDPLFKDLDETGPETPGEAPTGVEN